MGQTHSISRVFSSGAAGPLPAELAAKLAKLDFSAAAWEAIHKNRRLQSGIAQLDTLVGGGIVRGKISELIGPVGAGRTSIAAAFATSATYRGEVIGWIDATSAFDPASLDAAGVDLARVLWVSVRDGIASRRRGKDAAAPFGGISSALLKSAELILDAGGFGLIVIDFGNLRYPIPQSAALRLARAAARGATAVIVLASHRMCGTFASLSLALNRAEALFGRIAAGAPAVFDGLTLEVRVARNKLGGSGGRTIVNAMSDPLIQLALPFTNATGMRHNVSGAQPVATHHQIAMRNSAAAHNGGGN